ncbi:hypothetical protein NKH17_18340 [Mesorhizobium sp. M1334]|uniref:hypothetical protein n=1 Tax=Mesorhizobium sp. M1334 TaxID=2957084 RepID=UPI003339985F
MVLPTPPLGEATVICTARCSGIVFSNVAYLGVKAHRRFGAKVTFLHYDYAPMQQSAEAHKYLCDNMNLHIGAMSQDA